MGATSLVNPVGFVAWVPLVALSLKRRNLNPFLTLSMGGLGILALGLAALRFQPRHVFQTTLERFLTAIPADNIVGTIFHFIAFGQPFTSSVGYVLSFRFLLELAGGSLGYYFYPVGAAVAFVVFSLLVFSVARARSVPGTSLAFGY